jgi:diaminobutyrate-2-oxoglutarate transaminase
MLTHQPIEELESNVRYYSREYPAVFSRGEDALLFDSRGRRYIDFFCGAGVMNYGHNHPHLKNALLEYVQRNGIIHSLDFHTEARSEFLRRFQEKILAPRRLDYKVQFTGPTGTNAIEAALKLARKITRRSAVVAFTNAFHGVSLGALAATALPGNRRAAGVQLDQIIRLPFDGFLGSGLDIEYIRKMLTTRGSGLDAPAAILLETVQGEGGLNPASEPFIAQLFEIARQIGALVIVDEIQTGCGRVGPFFSFEHFSVVPDLVCLSKSISGLGLPMALLLMRPEHDQWEPGEHNGTFRGHNLAFVTGAAALDFWDDPAFLGLAKSNSEQLRERLDELCGRFASAVRKGRGLFTGLELHDGEVARRVKNEAFEHGLIVETCGPKGSVIKTMPPINIAPETLAEGLDVLEGALACALPTPAWAAGGGD